MNTSIKRRQTLLVTWLGKTLNCQPITRAESGSYYTEFSTQYTGKSVIRISDHLSADRTYIHIILSPINTTVIVNYKNFVWSGSFKDAKNIIYTLIMSKATTELCNPAPKNVTVIPTPKTTTKSSVTSVDFINASFMAEQKVINKDGLVSISKGDFKRMSIPQRQMGVAFINARTGHKYSGYNGVPDKNRYLSVEEINKIEQSK